MSKKKQIIIVILLLVIIPIIFVLFPYNSDDVYSFERYNREPLDSLLYGDNIIEEFKSPGDYNYIGFEYADYGSLIKKGEIEIKITNEKNKTKIKRIKAKKLFDNKSFYVKYKVKKNKKYTVTITNLTKNKITFYVTEAKISGSKLLYDDRNLIMYFKKSKKNYNLLWYYYMVVSIILSIKVLYVGGKNEK